LIALAQLRMRRALERESPERLKLRMWLYPWPTVFTLIAIAAIVVSMAFVDDEATRSYLIPSLISLGVVLVAAVIRQPAELARPERRKAAAAGSLPRRQLGGVR
jgi:GABA permease